MFKTIKNISFAEYLNFIQTAAVISGLLAAVNYFSEEPKMSVINLYTAVPESDRIIDVSHNEERFREFYKKFNLKIPDAIRKDRGLNRLLLTDLFPEKHYLFNEILSMSEEDFIKNLIRKDNILDEEEINRQISLKFAGGLETRLFKYKYIKHLYGPGEYSTIEENQFNTDFRSNNFQ